MECHCGKDGHPLGSINCPVHGREPSEMDDEAILHRNVARLRASPETLALRCSREHYLWLADRISELARELSHFANRA